MAMSPILIKRRVVNQVEERVKRGPPRVIRTGLVRVQKRLLATPWMVEKGKRAATPMGGRVAASEDLLKVRRTDKMEGRYPGQIREPMASKKIRNHISQVAVNRVNAASEDILMLF